MRRTGAGIREAWQRSKGRLLTVALVLTSTAYAVAENVTLTTYYPSPRGVYEELRLAADTAANMLQATATTSSVGNHPKLALQRALMSGGVPDNVVNGNTLGEIRWEGLDTGDNPTSDFVGGAVLRAEVDGAPAADDMPTRLVFLTDPPGLTVATERMRITSGGNVGIGGIVPLDMLDVDGALRVRGDRIRNNTGLALLQTNAGDWLRINPDQQFPAIAMYRGVAIGPGWGLSVGAWDPAVPAGTVYAGGSVRACFGGPCSWLRFTDGMNYLRGHTRFDGQLQDEQNPGYFVDPDQTSRMNAVHGNDFLIQNFPGGARWASTLMSDMTWSNYYLAEDYQWGSPPVVVTGGSKVRGQLYRVLVYGNREFGGGLGGRPINCEAGDPVISVNCDVYCNAGCSGIGSRLAHFENYLTGGRCRAEIEGTPNGGPSNWLQLITQVTCLER